MDALQNPGRINTGGTNTIFTEGIYAIPVVMCQSAMILQPMVRFTATEKTLTIPTQKLRPGGVFSIHKNSTLCCFINHF